MNTIKLHRTETSEVAYERSDEAYERNDEAYERSEEHSIQQQPKKMLSTQNPNDRQIKSATRSKINNDGNNIIAPIVNGTIFVILPIEDILKCGKLHNVNKKSFLSFYGIISIV